MYNFQSEDTPSTAQISVPYFEDAKADRASGYRTRKTIDDLRLEVAALITQLGGAGVRFDQGLFNGSPKRYGYIINFMILGANGNVIPCRIPIAGLPMRSETQIKKSQVLAQVLYAFAEYLQGELNALRFRPGYSPFAAYAAILPDNKTFMELVVSNTLQGGDQPQLVSGK